MPIEFEFAYTPTDDIKLPIIFENEEKKDSEMLLNEFLLDLQSKVTALDLKQKTTTGLFDMFLSLLKHSNDACKELIATDNGKTNPAKILDLTYDVVYRNLKSFRKVQKTKQTLSSNKILVRPIEKAFGTRYELKRLRFKRRVIQIPRRLQNTLQFVPILRTLDSLFACKEFSTLYFEYNDRKNVEKTGWDGSKLYSNFSSGSCFANSELFQKYPNSIQIQIAMDDYEPCNALQSKSGRHKICAVYFTIHNMPQKYSSKLVIIDTKSC